MTSYHRIQSNNMTVFCVRVRVRVCACVRVHLSRDRVGGKKLRGEVSVSEILPDYLKRKKKVALRYHLYTKCASCEFCSGFHTYNNSKRFAHLTL